MERYPMERMRIKFKSVKTDPLERLVRRRKIIEAILRANNGKINGSL